MLKREIAILMLCFAACGGRLIALVKGFGWSSRHQIRQRPSLPLYNTAKGAASEAKKDVDEDDRVLGKSDYWINQEDPLVIEDDKVIFQIRGVPRPLVRHRSSKGFMYNPSAAYQQQFQALVKELLWEEAHLLTEPFFSGDDQLSISLVFWMRRPNDHFRNRKRGEGRLKENKASAQFSPMRTDIDNLAKFVLDALNNVLYEDDHLVASLKATKCYDNDGCCEGSTVVCVQKLRNEDVPNIVRMS